MSCSTRREIGCYRCHGVYDGQGNVDWPGVHRPIGTDRGADRCRLRSVHRRVQPQSARGGRRAHQEPRVCGDAADRRVGQLSLPPQRQRADAAPSARPRIRASEDLRSHGGPSRSIASASASRSTSIPSDARLGDTELIRRFGDNRNWFNTARPGCSNAGHDFWPQIKTDANRRALIEYLKTL